MLPIINNINELEENVPSLTYNINSNTNRIVGFVDGEDAIKQAVYLMLQIERYESVIYNWYYGSEFESLIGKNKDFVKNEVLRMIKEALLEDDRILEIADFEIVFVADKAQLFFTVLSTLGQSQIELEVNL